MNMDMTQITIGSAKGRFTGTIEQAADWLERMQPSFPGIEFPDGSSEEIEVTGTPGAAGWRKGIEAALARAESGELAAPAPCCALASAGHADTCPARAAYLRDHAGAAGR
jgi:hypothetical protein